MMDAPEEKPDICPKPANAVYHITSFHFSEKGCKYYKWKKEQHEAYEYEKRIYAEDEA